MLRALLVEREPGDACENGVCSQQGRRDVDSGGGDPQVVGMDPVVEGVTGEPAGVTEFGDLGEQSVADRHDCCRPDRLLQPPTTLVTQPATRAP